MIVNAGSQDVKLILNGVELTNPSGSPMVVTAADEVTLILADGTVNTISDVDTYVDTSGEAPSSAIGSASDLSIAGSGSLSVTGNNNDAINSADGLVIAGGNVTVKAADDGIKGFNDVAISGGSVTASNSLEAIEAQTLVFSGSDPADQQRRRHQHLRRQPTGLHHHRRRRHDRFGGRRARFQRGRDDLGGSVVILGPTMGETARSTCSRG